MRFVATARSARIVAPFLLGTGVFVPVRAASSSSSSSSSGAGGAPASASSSSWDAVPLSFVAESVNYSSTEKAAAGRKGEDACFVGRYGIGVADGVGGWAEMGVDAGEYSRGLMAHASKHIEDATAKGATVVDPLEALTVAHRAVRVLGSSTACLATVGSDGVLRVRNLGDSGLMLWRHHLPLTSSASRKLPLDEAAKLWTLESETTAQTWGALFLPAVIAPPGRTDRSFRLLPATTGCSGVAGMGTSRAATFSTDVAALLVAARSQLACFRAAAECMLSSI